VLADHGQVAAAGEFGGGAGVHDQVETLGEVLLGAGRADVGQGADGLLDGVDSGDRVVEDGCGPSVTGDVGAGDEPEALGARTATASGRRGRGTAGGRTS
jgi:hypothetical protein